MSDNGNLGSLLLPDDLSHQRLLSAGPTPLSRVSVYQELSAFEAEANLLGLGPISHKAKAPVNTNMLLGNRLGFITRVESIPSQL